MPVVWLFLGVSGDLGLNSVTQILVWRHHQAGADPVWRPQLLQKTADGAAVGTLHGAWGEGLQVQVLDYQTTELFG